MTRAELITEIKKKKSFLCIGLDPDLEKLPKHLLKFEDPIYEFNARLIEATHDLCVAYKPNTAFYERFGSKGWITLEKTLKLLPKNVFSIADAKRGDIGNTSGYYADAFFKEMNCDSVTVAPYMGKDSVTPFLKHENKWVVLLGLTSNEGANDFQLNDLYAGGKLFEDVLKKSSQWGNASNMMYVIGATRPEMFAEVRKIIPDHFLLVPGVGAQGGSLEEVCKYGLNKDIGLLVNSSRAIIYAGDGEDFAVKARLEADKIQREMERFL
jgi:orotidine-5'-phosphate decarboxylase